MSDTSSSPPNALTEPVDRARVLDASEGLALVTTDAEGQITGWSPGAARLLGYDPHEVLGTALSLLQRDDGSWRHRRGDPVAVQVLRSALRDASGPVGETLVLQALPAERPVAGRSHKRRRRAEEGLLARESRYRLAMVHAPFPMAIVYEDDEVLQVNNAWARITGYRPDEIGTVRAWAERAYPERAAETRAYIMGLFDAPGTVDEGEFTLRTRDGRTRFWRFSSTPIGRSPDGCRMLLAMAVDLTSERQAEEALRESEALFRATFDRAGVGMVLADAEGRLLKTNPRFQEMLGYTGDALQRMTFTDITWHEDVQEGWGLYVELRGGRRDAYELEKRYVRSDGTIFWGRLISSAVRDADGAYLYAVAMVEDITARKEAEEARDRLVAILEATPDAVGIADAEGHTLYLNRAGREMLALGDEDPVGWPLTAFHPEWAASLVLREAMPWASAEGTWRGETALLTRDGRELPVSQVLLAHRNGDGEVRLFSTVIRDLSDRVRREREQRYLLEASRRLSGSLQVDTVLHSLSRLLVPSLGDYCFVDLVEGERIRRVISRHRDESKQDLMQRLCHHTAVRNTRLGLAQVLQTGEPVQVPEVTGPWLRAISTSPEHLQDLKALAPTSEMIVPLVAHGQSVGAVTVGSVGPGVRFGPEDLLLLQDLCSRAGLALDNARLFQDAQRAAVLRDEVLRVVAHDLRNPILSISLAVDLLHRKLGANEALRRHLDVVRRSVGEAQELIQDLLDVGQMQAGRLSMRPAPQDPADLIDHAVRQLKPIAQQKGQQLVVRPTEPLPPVQADRGRIQQVLSNLIGNALKFTQRGGRITVAATLRPDVVRFEVEDNGPGIAEDDLPKLFQPFWQAAHARGSGAGLGLPVVRGIIESHGGTVEVDSEVGRGTRMAFTLPLAESAAPTR